MTLQSMTGFARLSGSHRDQQWAWEIRSVNSKGLDVRTRVPNGFEALDVSLRKIASEKLGRGNLQVSLQLTQDGNKALPVVNEKAVEALLRSAKALHDKHGGQMPTLADILSIRGVVEMDEASLDSEERKELEVEMLQSFREAIEQLADARREEGKGIVTVLQGQLDTLQSLLDKVEKNSDRSPETIGERIKSQIDRLVQETENLDPQRLHQEAVMYAAKADIQEEIDRLKVHLASGRKLLSGEGPIGRKLDFLSQEFNRECNTICSKSNSAEVSSLGLDMKLVIDQFREQVQNLE